MSYERESVRRMAGYTPGEQPQNCHAVKLNTNENPYPPSRAVGDALRTLDPESLRRYPSPTSAGFREVAARLHGVDPDNIVATNGGDELLRLAVTTFVEPGAPIGVAEPSYSLYPVLAAVNGSPVVRVPLETDWRPPANFAQQLNDAGVNLAFVVNPHAPSGTLLDADKIAAMASALNGVLLVDEAYVDFVDPSRRHDLIPLIREHHNLLILRTLSKGYSLAGLRFGYGIAAASLIEPIASKTRDSYSVDAVAERLATAALQDREAASRTWADVRKQRDRLTAGLNGLGFDCLPSEANFVLAQAPDGSRAEAVYEALKARDIYVRYFAQDGLRDRLRISVGLPEENDNLLAALRDILGGTLGLSKS